MPIFEYRCKECGEKFETLILSSARSETVKCENCGSEQTEKLMSAFASGGLNAGSSYSGSSAGGCGAGGFS